jgi:type IV secretion system protein VirB3
VEREVLWLALTRPALIRSLPFEAWVVLVLGTFFIGLWSGNPLLWASGIVFYWPIRLLTSRDFNIFRILRLWLITKGPGDLGADLWGGSLLVALPERPKAKDRASAV